MKNAILLFSKLLSIYYLMHYKQYMKNIIIVGGGFAGVGAAIELGKKKEFKVTLISERDYLYLYPFSIWVPVGINQFNDVKLSLKQIAQKHHFQFVTDTITHISMADNTIGSESEKYEYDYLILAIGNEKVQIAGIEQTHNICGKPDLILELKAHLDKLVSAGKGKIAIGFGGNPKDMSAMRGGPAFEMIFNINTYLKRLGIRHNFELSFFAPMAQPGAKMGKNAPSMLYKMMETHNIKKYFGKKIKEFKVDGVVFEDDSQLTADLTLFVPAGKGPALFSKSGLPVNDAGFVRINDFCQVEGLKNVFAIGDSAAIQGPDWIAKQGHIAEIMGKISASNIQAIENGKSTLKGYAKHLNIVCIMDTGDGAAIVYRDAKKSFIIPLPFIGHWIKRLFGRYMKFTKTGRL